MEDTEKFSGIGSGEEIDEETGLIEECFKSMWAVDVFRETHETKHCLAKVETGGCVLDTRKAELAGVRAYFKDSPALLPAVLHYLICRKCRETPEIKKDEFS